MVKLLMSDSFAATATKKSHKKNSIVTALKKTCYRNVERPLSVYTQTAARLTAQSNRVLDIGCGHAAPALMNLPASDVIKIGIDAVDSLSKPEDANTFVLRADCSRLPFAADSFDLVMCRSVLEHLEHPDLVFSEVRRVLTPQGRMLFLTPNWWDYVSLGSSLIPNRLHPRLVKLMTGRAEKKTFPTFYQANTTQRLRSLADKAGLAVVSLETLREHPHYLQFNSLAYSIGLVYEQLLQRRIKQLRPWILGNFRRNDEDETENYRTHNL